jgi:hypothetical protein
VTGNSKSCETPCDTDLLENGVELDSYTRKRIFGCGTLYITVNKLTNKPMRVFVGVGKIGNCERALLEGVGRLLTILLECGGKGAVMRARDTLRGMRCPQGLPSPKGNLSCMDSIAFELTKFLPQEEEQNAIPVHDV